MIIDEYILRMNGRFNLCKQDRGYPAKKRTRLANNNVIRSKNAAMEKIGVNR